MTWGAGAEHTKAWQAIAEQAKARFKERVDPVVKDWLDERVGHGFSYSIDLPVERLAQDWEMAVDALAERVTRLEGRVYFERFKPLDDVVVMFCSVTSCPRLIVQYVPPTVSDAGELVPGFVTARFAVCGIQYVAGA